MSGTIVENYRDTEEKVRRIEILTPEGVPLTFVVASAGDRVWGFFIDAALILLVLVVAVLLPSLLFTAAGASGFASAMMSLAFFLLRNFYFTYFEIHWQGATPGKRRAGTRVIDRRGRPLTSGAVFVVAVVWFVGVALLPLFNRDRLRVGDLIAGTLVVRAPKAVLYADLAESPAARTRYTFTPEQLDVYGIYELQVLEEVLRRGGRVGRKPKRIVAEKIIDKIGWDGDVRGLDIEVFLNEFYTAQRARLEQKMLFGERREKKALRRGKRRR